MFNMLSGKTCISCAKAKIKCDKMLPTCSRCARLGIDCHAQARGRGRPKGIFPETNKQKKEQKAVSLPPKQMMTVKDTSSLPRAALQKTKSSTMKNNLMMIESIKTSLQTCAEKGLKGDGLMKCMAVTNWLLDVACCSKSEAMYDDIANVYEVTITILFTNVYFHFNLLKL